MSVASISGGGIVISLSSLNHFAKLLMMNPDPDLVHERLANLDVFVGKKIPDFQANCWVNFLNDIKIKLKGVKKMDSVISRSVDVVKIFALGHLGVV